MDLFAGVAKWKECGYHPHQERPVSRPRHVGRPVRTAPRGSQRKVDAPTRARVLGGSLQREHATCAVHTVDVRY